MDEKRLKINMYKNGRTDSLVTIIDLLHFLHFTQLYLPFWNRSTTHRKGTRHSPPDACSKILNLSCAVQHYTVHCHLYYKFVRIALLLSISWLR